MGMRLTKIQTRRGDNGTTSLADGSRVIKSDLRINALGEVDELNCAIGLILASNLPESLTTLFNPLLATIQNDLFEIGAELALPGHHSLTEIHLSKLEQVLEQLSINLPPLQEFILPGGTHSAAICHLARAICRRTERALVALSQHDAVHPVAIRYLNRLSDLLFITARTINYESKQPEQLWQRAVIKNNQKPNS